MRPIFKIGAAILAAGLVCIPIAMVLGVGPCNISNGGFLTVLLGAALVAIGGLTLLIAFARNLTDKRTSRGASGSTPARTVRDYRGDGFSVRIEPGHRELVSVIHERDGATLKLSAERIGKKWEGIAVRIPQEIEVARASQVARDLEAAFQAEGYGYVIARVTGVDVVPESERAAAIAELRQMGFEVEISADRKVVQTKQIPGAPNREVEDWRKLGPRFMFLVQSVRGTRTRFEALARSKEFADDSAVAPDARPVLR